jgi:hypothetical protein
LILKGRHIFLILALNSLAHHSILKEVSSLLLSTTINLQNLFTRMFFILIKFRTMLGLKLHFSMWMTWPLRLQRMLTISTPQKVELMLRGSRHHSLVLSMSTHVRQEFSKRRMRTLQEMMCLKVLLLLFLLRKYGSTRGCCYCVL